MIREIASLSIDPANAAEFEAAVARARPLFERSEGCRSFGLERVIETPGAYRLVVSWDSVAHHMDLFRNSSAFTDWRALVGPFLLSPPAVVHVEDVALG